MNDQWKRSALTQVASHWGARLVGLEALKGVVVVVVVVVLLLLLLHMVGHVLLNLHSEK